MACWPSFSWREWMRGSQIYSTVWQKPGIEMGSSWKGLWQWLLPNGTNPCDIHKRGFLRILYQEKDGHLDLKETEDKLKDGWQIPKVLQVRSRLITRVPLSIERRENSKGRVLGPEARDKGPEARAEDPEGRASSHKLSDPRIYLPAVWNCLESVNPFF